MKSLRGRIRRLLHTVRPQPPERPQLPEKICFVHIPKCGGTSLEHALRSENTSPRARVNAVASARAARLSRGADTPYEGLLQLRQELLFYHMSHPALRLVSGHVPFSETAFDAFGESYRFITVLRQPVARWFSSYFFYRYKTHSDHRRIDEELPEHLASPRAEIGGRMLVTMLGGLDPEGDYRSAQAIERAKRNLERFTLVGLMEHLDDFARRFERRFGRRLRIPHRNRNPRRATEIHAALTPEIEREVERLCQPDIAVYAHALTRFGPPQLPASDVPARAKRPALSRRR